MPWGHDLTSTRRSASRAHLPGEADLIDGQESVALPVAAAAPALIEASRGTPPRAAPPTRDRKVRAAVLAVELAGTRIRAEETRARYAAVLRKVTATGEGTAAVTGHLAELSPHRAKRLRALSATAETAAQQWRQAAGAAGRSPSALIDPGPAGPAWTGAKSPQAIRAESAALAHRLEEAMAGLRATFARIQQGRPRHEILHHSAMARMRAQLDTMPVIEQAKGIIMAHSHGRQDEAFDLLRRASQRQNVPVRELAAQLVAKTTGGPLAASSCLCKQATRAG